MCQCRCRHGNGVQILDDLSHSDSIQPVVVAAVVVGGVAVAEPEVPRRPRHVLLSRSAAEAVTRRSPRRMRTRQPRCRLRKFLMKVDPVSLLLLPAVAVAVAVGLRPLRHWID